MSALAAAVGHGAILGLYLVGVFMLALILAEAAIRLLCAPFRARFDRTFVAPLRRRAERKRRA